MNLPMLFKRTSTGAVEQWRVWTEGADIVTEYGHTDGKLQQARETAVAKNTGKANATTPEEQARAQAKSDWTAKQARKGYVDSLTKAEAGENAGAGGIRPMLAQSFSKHGDKITFPCSAQPKLDGIRCIAVVGEWGNVTLWSREQKPITAVPHIAAHIAGLGLPVGTVLDGELYNHKLKNDFEKIVSIVRKQTVADPNIAALVQYHVYDIPRIAGYDDGPKTKYIWDDRWQHLATKVLDNPFDEGQPLVRVETVAIKDKDALLEYFEACRAAGYEGCMARGNTAFYEEGKRSYQLQKLKEFDEAEFPIVGVEEGVGKMAGLAIFVCQTGADTFRCKMEGALEGLRKYFLDDSLWKGKKLTVKYQGLTGKAKVPRFPVGKSIRDYE